MKILKNLLLSIVGAMKKIGRSDWLELKTKRMALTSLQIQNLIRHVETIHRLSFFSFKDIKARDR